MNEALRELMKEEIQEEIKAERQDATDTIWLTAIKNIMQKKKCDAKTAMEELCISAADQLRYMTML